MKKSAVILFSMLAALFLAVSILVNHRHGPVITGMSFPQRLFRLSLRVTIPRMQGLWPKVISDPDSAANKLFKYDHSVIEGKQTYKMDWGIQGGTTATILARIRGMRDPHPFALPKLMYATSTAVSDQNFRSVMTTRYGWSHRLLSITLEMPKNGIYTGLS